MMAKIIPDNRKYAIDQNYFNQISTPSQAFWAGYMIKYHRSILTSTEGGNFFIISFNEQKLADQFLIDFCANYNIFKIGRASCRERV